MQSYVMDTLPKQQLVLQKKFELLFQEYSDAIYRFCLYKTSNEQVAHDLTQETFLRVWTTVSASKHIDKPKQYIYQVARNLIIDYYKSKKSLSLDAMQDNGFDPPSSDMSAELSSELSILRTCINALDKEFRDVIYMKFVEDMGISDIAKALKISENLVSVRIHRGKKQLKNQFT